MLETPHSLVGGALGAATGNPYAAAGLGVGSHFAGDLIPHWNPTWPFKSKKLYAFVIADFVIAEALVLAFWMWFPDHPEIAIGAFFGTVPDIVLGLRYIFKIRWLRGYERFHGRMGTEVAFKYGIWPQLVFSLLAVWYLTTV